MLLLLTLLGIAKYFVIGAATLIILQKQNFVDKKLSTPFFVVFSFLIGTLISSILLHIGLVTNTMPFVHLLVLVIAATSIVYILLSQRAKLLNLFQGNPLILGIFSTGYLWQTFLLASQPVMANDARGIWLLKTKALLLGSSSFFDYLRSTLYSYSHTDYPISIPLLYAGVLKPLSSFWEPATGILSFTFFFMLIVGIYGTIRHFTRFNEFTALAISCVIFFTPEYLRQGWAGLSDVPLSLVFFAVILGLLLIKNYLQPKEYLLPIAFALFAATIKNEGLTFLLLTLILVAGNSLYVHFASKKNLRALLKQMWMPTLLVTISAIPLLTWKVLLMKYHVTNDIFDAPNLSDIIARIPVLVSEIMPRLLDGYRFGILFIPALLLLALPTSKKLTYFNWSLIILGQAAVYLAIYLITPHDLAWHISTSFSRLLLHLLPSLFLLTFYHRSTKSIV